MQQAVCKSSWACAFCAIVWDEIRHILQVNSHLCFMWQTKCFVFNGLYLY
jgi:hypothetical protein